MNTFADPKAFEAWLRGSIRGHRTWEVVVVEQELPNKSLVPRYAVELANIGELFELGLLMGWTHAAHDDTGSFPHVKSGYAFAPHVKIEFQARRLEGTNKDLRVRRVLCVFTHLEAA